MGKRIMIVDDAKFIRVILTNILEEAGYEVVGEAEDGKVALEKYPELKPDLLLLDIIMPEMEGNVVLGKLMKDYPDAKVLIISAVGQRLLVDKALKSGAAGYIVKPISPENVLNEVERIIGPPDKNTN
ncbi:two-component system response regulator [bacterium]|nr:MAG: two-component system response regulator [bacterium]